MYRVLLVEDEIIVREWLKKRVDWGRYELTVCGEAANGRDALAVYERENPDIIVTDLRMPDMDGITLLRNVREMDKRVRFLILTCLDEFKLVKQAIELDVTSYILKLTSEPNEIEQELLKAKDYLERYDEVECLTRKDSVRVRQGMEEELLEECEELSQNPRYVVAQQYLEEHYADNISLEQIAEYVGLTPKSSTTTSSGGLILAL